MTAEFDPVRLATAYRRLVLWFGGQLVFGLGSVALDPVADDGVALALAALFGLGSLVTVVALAIYGSRTATALGSSAGWLWGVAMFIPCVNVVTLLTLSAKATSACRAAGIPVGFFGPKVPPGTPSHTTEQLSDRPADPTPLDPR